MSPVPAHRIRAVNTAPVRPTGEWVVYWMIAARRTTFNWALERALEHCRELDRPLLVLEALRVGYRWASDRLHRFAIDAMADNAVRISHSRALHYAYVEPEPGAGKGLLESLGSRACVVVTDEFPEFFLPAMVEAAGRELREQGVRLEQVDGNGLLPLRATDRAWTHAHHFRRFLQRELPRYLAEQPARNPFRNVRIPVLPELPPEIAERWPPTSPALLGGEKAALAALPIDHGVPPVPFRGGPQKAQSVLRSFMNERLPRYAEHRNEPWNAPNSGLSPYLHWGMISVHQVFGELAEREGWTPERLAAEATGKRERWWGMSRNAEAFLEELVIWRELSYNTSLHLGNHHRYASLPDWARRTLDKHRDDPRHEIGAEELEAGQSPDALWNATQGQLLRDGRIHNYMRIVWGKRFLEWTPSPEAALEAMIGINNRWALDGRNPNSYSGIFWCLGRYDRAWGPERPVFGTVRYVSSANTARKVPVARYVEEYAPPGPV